MHGQAGAAEQVAHVGGAEHASPGNGHELCVWRDVGEAQHALCAALAGDGEGVRRQLMYFEGSGLRSAVGRRSVKGIVRSSDPGEACVGRIGCAGAADGQKTRLRGAQRGVVVRRRGRERRNLFRRQHAERGARIAG